MNQENILQILGIEDLTEGEKQKVLADLETIICNRVLNRLISYLTVQEQQEIVRIADKEEKELDKYLEKRFPDYDDIIEEEIALLALQMKQRLENADEDVRRILSVR